MAELKKYIVERNGAVYHVLVSEADAKRRGLKPVAEPRPPVKADTPTKQARPANKAATPADK